MKKSPSCRKGNRHNKDNVLFGGYVTPEFKALAQLTASVCKTNCVELMKRGIYTEATRVGIMWNGIVKPEYRDTVDALANHIRIERENRKTERGKE